MTYLPDTNACITLLRQRNPLLLRRWQVVKASEIALRSVVVYELRYGAGRCSDPPREHARLDSFLKRFISLSFDDACAQRSAEIRRLLERTGNTIGPYDIQIAAIALQYGLTLITHNVREFQRIPDLLLEDWEQ